MLVLECCGGIRFVGLPFIGLLEWKFALGAACAACALPWLVAKLFRRRPRLAALGALAVAAALPLLARLADDARLGVRGWTGALAMARVDARSDTARIWSSVATDRLRYLASLPAAERHAFERFEAPHRVRVLSDDDAARAARAVRDDRAWWVHMDHRAGPLPAFIYGLHFQHTWPVDARGHGPRSLDMRAARLAWERLVNSSTGGAPGGGAPGGGAPGGDVPGSGAPRRASAMSYTDAASGAHACGARANATLHAAGLRVHERVRAAIAALTGEPAAFHDDWGLPGVYVTYSHAAFSLPVFQAHIDGSHAPFPRDEQCAPHLALSFTLALQLPRAGAGLTLHRLRGECDWSVAVGATHSEERMRGALACLEETREPYAVGEMVVHAGYLIHAIAPWRMAPSAWRAGEPAERDARITLQGFAFRCDGVWRLHW